MSRRLSVRVLLGLLLIAGSSTLVSCSKEKASEKLAEGILEKATGKNADVDIKGSDVSIKTGDTNVKMTKTDEWPADMFGEVPRFTYGKIERVTQSTEDGKRKFNIYLMDVADDASEKYAEDLRQAGWDSHLSAMGGEAGLLQAQKGTLAVQFMHSKLKRTAVFVAFEVEG